MINLLHTLYERKTSIQQLIEKLDDPNQKASIQFIVNRLVQNCSVFRNKMISIVVDPKKDFVYVGFFLVNTFSFTFSPQPIPILYFNAKIITQTSPHNGKMKHIYQVTLHEFKIINKKVESVEIVDPTLLSAITGLHLEEIK